MIVKSNSIMEYEHNVRFCFCFFFFFYFWLVSVHMQKKKTTNSNQSKCVLIYQPRYHLMYVCVYSIRLLLLLFWWLLFLLLQQPIVNQTYVIQLIILNCNDKLSKSRAQYSFNCEKISFLSCFFVFVLFTVFWTGFFFSLFFYLFCFHHFICGFWVFHVFCVFFLCIFRCIWRSQFVSLCSFQLIRFFLLVHSILGARIYRPFISLAIIQIYTK